MLLTLRDAYLMIFLFSLLCISSVSIGTDETDIACLKSIKDSLVDRNGYLISSWNFNSSTEGFICRFRGVECYHLDKNRIRRISLSQMGLQGKFPMGLQYCTLLVSLDLSSNKLFGPIPDNISHVIPSVTFLDLSSNRFSGKIPAAIANCSLLNVLRLDSNRLTGNIPLEISRLDWINNFSVANNMLSGPVPRFVNPKFPSDSYANNSGLCGGPLKPCGGHRKEFGYSFKSGFVIGYAVSAVSVMVVFVSYCVPWVHLRNRGNTMTMMKKNRKMADEASGSPTVELVYGGGKEISELEKLIPRISFTALNKTTGSFDQNNVIGVGKVGTMYKAAHPYDCITAVKRVNNCQHLEKQFMSELMILGKFRHMNVIPLLGFCIESRERLLAYKYMPNGNLHDWLYPVKAETEILDWHVKVKIAIGIARGLAWLHHYNNFPIAHLNITSRCILLDKNFEPKISNFGEAMHMSSNAKDFIADSKMGELDLIKKDVYQFGILLLELITGKDPDNSRKSSHTLEETLVERITYLSSGSSSLYQAVDKSLLGQGFDGEIFHFLKIASSCTHHILVRRPTMLQVFQMLMVVRERDRLIENPEILTQTVVVTASSGDDSFELELTETK